MSHFKAENAPNSISAGAPPQTPVGELTALPQPPSWIERAPTSKGKGWQERGKKGRGKRKGRGKKGRRRKGGKGGERKGREWTPQEFSEMTPLFLPLKRSMKHFDSTDRVTQQNGIFVARWNKAKKLYTNALGSSERGLVHLSGKDATGLLHWLSAMKYDNCCCCGCS